MKLRSLRLALPPVLFLPVAGVALLASTTAYAQGEPAPAAPATTTPSADPPKDPTAADGDKKDEKKGTDAEDPKKKAAAPAGADATPAPGGEPGGISVSLGSGQPRKDEAKVDSKKAEGEELPPNRFAGSVFFWDHSVSTQTARVEPNAQQSYTPSYAWWFSLQPRYHITKRLQYRLRADLYKDMTNAEETTLYRENVLGDVWNTIRYEMPLSERLKHTKVGFSGTIKLPLSKESQAKGTYFKPGVGASIAQKIPINGESAKWFPGAGASLSAGYEHPITRSTTPTDLGDFQVTRQDAAGRSVISDQLSGSMMPAHTVLASVRGDLSITEKWGLNLSMIFINNWLYAPTGDQQVRTATGMVDVPRDSNAARFVQSTWLIAATDYDIMDEVSVGIGYYNLAGAIAPNGQRRSLFGTENVLWSPAARIFATVTANLDKIYDRAAGVKPPEKKAASASSSTY